MQFVLYVDTNNHVGSGEFVFELTGGSVLPFLPSYDHYISFTLLMLNNSYSIPTGHHYEVDAAMEWIPSLAVQTDTFSHVKSLFR